ncbi:MAG: TetR/AcrR family transcriptional regulator [Gammaproteobacteria bacterium]|nr:MAG: TetR/AcrR family transcriptional regulator [Gammaproteobacteria bacterium]
MAVQTKTNPTKKTAKRTRLSPEARRDQILDSAKQSILENGLQQLSLKQLAVDAGVSEPLLFHYFSSRLELLQKLLERDFTRSIESLNESLDGAESLEEILRIYITRNYDQCDEESVIEILLAETEIASAIESYRSQNARSREQLLIKTISKALGISRKKAAMIAVMASAASMSAAKFAHDRNMGREEAIKTVIEFVRAGFQSQASGSGTV